MTTPIKFQNFEGGRVMSFEDVGKALGITKQAAQQLEKSALRKLRKKFTQEEYEQLLDWLGRTK